VAGSYEHSNEPFGSIKGGEFLDYLCILSASLQGFCRMESLAVTRPDTLHTDMNIGE